MAGMQATAGYAPATQTRKSRLALLCFWLVCWLFLVVAIVPAGWVLPLLGNQLQASALSGSLWQGQAHDAQLGPAAQQIAVGHLRWRFLPWQSLRTTSVCVALSSELGVQVAAGRVCLRGRNSLELLDWTLELPAAATQRANGLPLRGSMLLHLSRLQLYSGRLAALAARGSWENAALHSGAQWLELGELGLEAGLDEANAPLLRIVDIAAPVHAQLQVSRDQDGRLSLRGDVLRKADTPPALLQALTFLARDSDGERYRIDLSY